MLRKFFHIKPSSPSVIKKKSSIELLLEGSVDPHQLYLLLNKDGKSKLNPSDGYGGLGKVFRKEKRHRLIDSAFKIDDTKGSETASVSNFDELFELAKAFNKGNIHGIKKNINKHIICLALIFNLTSDAKLKRKALDQIDNIYHTDFKYHHDASKILSIIKSKPLEKPVLVDNKIDTTSPFYSATVIEKLEKQITTDDKTSTQLIAPLLAPSQNNNTILLVNVIRKLLIDNVDTWHKKTTGGMFFFGGTKTEHPDPAKKGHFLRLPDGIAKMLGCLKSKNLLAGEVTDQEVANSTLQDVCRIALQRYQFGDRSCTRYKETNKLYSLLTSLTTVFNTKDMKAVKNINPAHAEIDTGNITQEFIDEMSSLLKYPDPSNVIILKR